MPHMVNGIGTTIIPARGYIAWGDKEAVDSVEWFVIFLMPIIPYRTVHAFDWTGTQYRFVPIKWSFALVVRSFLRSWLSVVGLGAIGAAIMAIVFWIKEGPAIVSLVSTIVAIVVGLSWWLGCRIWNWTDVRAANTRYVLGPHNAGTSDPATWLDDMLGDIRVPEDLYGTKTYAEAVEPLLARGEFSQAMWAARLTVALESAEEGETLTDQVLEHSGVKYALEEMLSRRSNWADVMFPPQRAPAQPTAPSEGITEHRPSPRASREEIQEQPRA